MGWLRVLMEDGDVRSFGELARRALSHPGWPQEIQPAARSLASLFSKLDRDIELEWLRSREAVQPVLAELLGCEVSTVRRAAGLSQSDTRRVLKLVELPDARPLDLLLEPLPPGVPARLSEPATWGRLCWTAASGAGRTLTGLWLRARGLAEFIQAERLSELPAALQPERPIFVEIERPPEAHEFAAWLQRQSSRRAPLCVAADAAAVPATWTRIATHPDDGWRAALLDWIERRLPADGQFDPDAAERWWQDYARTQLPHATFATVLSVAGLMDEVGTSSVRRLSVRELAQQHVYKKLRGAADRDSRHARSLLRVGDGAEVASAILLDIARRNQTDVPLPLATARPETAWLELVPERYRKAIDPEWLRLSLLDAGTRLSPTEIDRAVAALPPGGYQLIAALRDAEILTGSARRLAVSPRWMCEHLSSSANSSLVRSPLEVWGEAVLQRRARQLLPLLQSQLETEPESLIRAALDLPETTSAAGVAAFELVFRAVGLKLATQATTPVVETDVARELWDEQQRLLVDHSGVFRCRFEYGPVATSAGDPELSRAGFVLACWAVTERAGAGRVTGSLVPWAMTEPSELRRELDVLYQQFSQSGPRDQELLVATYHVVGRLCERHGALDHPLAAPWRLAAAAIDETPLTDLLEQLPAGPGALDVAAELANQGGVNQTDFWRRVWEHAILRDLPECLTTPRGSTNAWRHIPSECLRTLLVSALTDAPIPYAELTPRSWSTVCDAWRHTGGSIPSKAAAIDAMPLDVLSDAIVSDTFSGRERAVAERVWQRAPNVVRGHAFDLLAARSGATSTGLNVVQRDPTRVARAFEWLTAAPPNECERAIARLEKEFADPQTVQPLIDPLARYLHRLIQIRTPGWQAAYALLDRVAARQQHRL